MAGTCAQRIGCETATWLPPAPAGNALAGLPTTCPTTSRTSAPKRLAPHTMLTMTAYFVGRRIRHRRGVPRIPRNWQRNPAMSLALALATSGQVISLFSSQLRIPDSAALAAELVEMVDRIDCDAATELELLRSVMLAQYVTGDFDGTLRTIERIHRLSDDPTSVPVVHATSHPRRDQCLAGDHERGRTPHADRHRAGARPQPRRPGCRCCSRQMALVPAGLEIRATSSRAKQPTYFGDASPSATPLASRSRSICTG